MNTDKIFATIAQAYSMITKKKPSKKDMELVLQILGEDGIQACAQVVELGPEAVAKVMLETISAKQAQMAKYGAKLQRIQYLKNNF